MNHDCTHLLFKLLMLIASLFTVGVYQEKFFFTNPTLNSYRYRSTDVLVSLCSLPEHHMCIKTHLDIYNFKYKVGKATYCLHRCQVITPAHRLGYGRKRAELFISVRGMCPNACLQI